MSSDHYHSDPSYGCGAVIFLVLNLVAAVVCLWAVTSNGGPLFTVLGLAGLFGVIVSAGSILAGVPDWPERR